MVKERINEMVDFAKSESPYKSANKGWLSKDIYINLGKSQNQLKESSDKLANISINWNKELAIIFFGFGFFLTSLLAISYISFIK